MNIFGWEGQGFEGEGAPSFAIEDVEESLFGDFPVGAEFPEELLVELARFENAEGFDCLLFGGHVPEVVEGAAASGGVEGGVHREGR